MEIVAVENKLTRIKRAIYGDPTGRIRTFAILSADNPMGKKADPQDNNINRKRIKSILKDPTQSLEETLNAGSYQYVIQEGHYGDKEQSFFIFNISLNGAISLATRFKQESFIWGKYEDGVAKISLYGVDKDLYDRTGDFGYSEELTSKGTNLLDEAEDFYSKVKGFKYSFDFNSLDFIPSGDQVAFEQSLNDDYSGKTQYFSRIKSQKPHLNVGVYRGLVTVGKQRIPGYFSTADNSYVGDEDFVKFLDSKGISLVQKANPKHSTASIGYNPEEKKWYGWSHRAIYGFGVGHKCKAGDSGVAAPGQKTFSSVWYPQPGYVCRTIEDCKRVAIAFADSVS